MSDTFLIIGGGGFIGRHLVLQLARSGAQVRVLDLIEKPDDFPETIEWITGSILNPDDLSRAISGCDIVFHLAALAHLGIPQTARYDQVNALGTQAVIEAAKSHNIQHLLITSTEVILRGWRDALNTPLRVTETLPDMSAMAGPYCRSKLKAEIAARQAMKSGQPISLLYPTVPVGPGDFNLTAPTAMIRQFLVNPPPATLDCRLNLVPVEDVAKAHILAAQQAPQQKYMLGGQDVEMSDFLDWLAPVTSKKLPKRNVPYGLAAMTAHIAQIGAKFTGRAPLASVEGVRLARRKIDIDSTATQNALDWQAGSSKDAVKRAAIWLKETGFLET